MVNTTKIARDAAKKLYRNRTESEKVLSAYLKSKNVVFKEQVAVGKYIVDFYFPLQHKIVELDGAYHNERKQYDATRDVWLKDTGYEILRIPSYHVFKNIHQLFIEINCFLNTKNKNLNSKTKKAIRQSQTLGKNSPYETIQKLDDDHLPVSKKEKSKPRCRSKNKLKKFLAKKGFRTEFIPQPLKIIKKDGCVIRKTEEKA